LTEAQKTYLKESAKLIFPDGFAGGCEKSDLGYFCRHYKPDGTLAKIDQNCPNWYDCSGNHFRYNI